MHLYTSLLDSSGAQNNDDSLEGTFPCPPAYIDIASSLVPQQHLRQPFHLFARPLLVILRPFEVRRPNTGVFCTGHMPCSPVLCKVDGIKWYGHMGPIAAVYATARCPSLLSGAIKTEILGS